MRSALLSTVLFALALSSGSALAQDRSPALRQNLVDLAYVLGEAHALRQACQGADDQFWRLRMIRLVDTEQPDAALDRRLKESFNAGFASRQSEFPACTPASRRAAAQVAVHGQQLAAGLAKVMNEVRPQPPATSDAPPPAAPH
jgi:uncharacterized protein (TIGR02301 family)